MSTPVPIALLLIVWIVYVLIPAAGWGLLSGRPIGVAGTVVLLAVWWLVRFRGIVPAWRIVAVLLLFKISLGLPFLLDRGWLAFYYANDAWRSPHERSLDFLTIPGTRIDDRLEFGDRQRPFPLFFFNDGRFNYIRPPDPDRGRLAFSVAWSGWLFVPVERQYRVTMMTPNAGATVTVDGRALLESEADESPVERALWLEPGWRRFDVRYASAYSAPRRLSVTIVRDRGDRAPAAVEIYSVPAASWRLTVDAVLRRLSQVLEAIALTVVAVALLHGAGLSLAPVVRWASRPWREGFPASEAASIGALAVVVWVLGRSRSLAGAVVMLSGGDDWLVYETQARDIALNGPLMTQGHALGQGAPFYLQPFYSYFMALVHVVIGEDFWGIHVVQRLLLAGMVWAVCRLTAELFGTLAGWLAFVLAWYFAVTARLGTAPPDLVLLTESLFVPVVVFWTLALVRLARDRPPARGSAAAVGVLGGIAVLTRSTLLVAMPFVLTAIAYVGWRRWGWRVAPGLGVLVMAVVVTIGLATVRNMVVSGRPVLVASSGPVNLLIGNQPPPDVDVSRAGTRAIYARFGLGPEIRTVVEYAIQAPVRFVDGVRQRAAFALGLTERGREPRLLLFLSVTAAAGLVLLSLRLPAGADLLAWLPAILAMSHLIVVTVIGVFTYGYCVVYPAHVLLLPYSAWALTWLVPWRRP